MLSAYKVSACRGLLRDGAAAGIAVVSRLVVRSVWYVASGRVRVGSMDEVGIRALAHIGNV